ncbi:MAG: hypothetical protein ACYTF0_09115 [Planctomycetota bacterium]|jgi:hypothetical protein
MNPDAPTETSYSDPIYDRLEGLLHTIGRRWWALALVAIITCAVVLSVEQQSEQSPLAAGAVAVRQAGADRSALIAIADDPTIANEFRARAALNAATLSANDGALDEAGELLSQAAGLATDNSTLALTVELSVAALAEERGQWQEANDAYHAVLSRANSNEQRGLNLTASLGAARTSLALAEASKDASAAAELRAEAHELLRYVGEQQGSDSRELGQYARFLLLDSERHAANAAPAAQVKPEEAVTE